jgi:hypothetical protein
VQVWSWRPIEANPDSGQLIMALPEGKHELTLHRRAEDRRFTVLISFIITIWPAES